MQAACAPHYPAEPRALVGADVLPLLSRAEAPPEGGQAEAPREGMGPELAAGAAEVARRFFVLTDAARFGPGGADAGNCWRSNPSWKRCCESWERRL